MNDTTRKREEKLTEEMIRRTRGCLPAEELAAYHDGTIQPQNRRGTGTAMTIRWPSGGLRRHLWIRTGPENTGTTLILLLITKLNRDQGSG